MAIPRRAPAETSPDDVLDELLVLRGQAGDRDAIEELVVRWQPRLIGYARRLVGHGEVARDVVQEAWIGIVKGLHRLDDPRRFRAFAMRVVLRRAVDESRRSPPPTSPLLHEPEAALESDDPAGVLALRSALLALPPNCVALLAMRYAQNLDVRTIAKLIEVPVGTVKSRLHGARERLREVLGRRANP